MTKIDLKRFHSLCESQARFAICRGILDAEANTYEAALAATPKGKEDPNIEMFIKGLRDTEGALASLLALMTTAVDGMLADAK